MGSSLNTVRLCYEARPDPLLFLTPAFSMAASYNIEQRFKVRDPITRKLVPPPVLHLNDASLVWGGKFDIAGKWVGDHKGHKKGIVIDIRMNSTLGSVPINKYEAFKIMASESYGADAQAHCSKGFSFIKDQCKGDPNRHIHMLLLGKDG